MILRGKEASTSIKDRLKKAKYKGTLAVVQFDADDSSKVYLNSRIKLGKEIGIKVISYECNNYSQKQAEEIINKLNGDPKIDGIMIDRPLPKHLNEVKLIKIINPSKDVECLTEKNKLNKDIYAPVAFAVIALAKHYNIKIKNSSAAVVGDSLAVGKPIAKALLENGAKVKVFNRENFTNHNVLKNYDIVVSAVGKKRLIKNKNVSKKSVLFDIGVNVKLNGKTCGDFTKSAYKKSSSYAPTPGGVGPLTTIGLFYNLFVLKGAIHE